MDRFSFLLAVCLLVASGASEDSGKSWGPFDIDFQEVTKCNEEGTGDIVLDNIQVKVADKHTVVASVDATSKITVDNNVTMEAEVSSFQDGAYSPKIMKFPVGPVCDAMERYFPKSYRKFYKSLGIDGCPVPPGSWQVKKFPFEFELPVKNLPYKKIRLDVVLYNGKQRIACVRYFFRTVPEGSIKH